LHAPAEQPATHEGEHERADELVSRKVDVACESQGEDR
jgi:hypothetical protein